MLFAAARPCHRRERSRRRAPRIRLGMGSSVPWAIAPGLALASLLLAGSLGLAPAAAAAADAGDAAQAPLPGAAAGAPPAAEAAPAPAESAPADPQEVEKGRRTYRDLCQKCHGLNMVSTGGGFFDLRTFPLDQKPRFVNSVTNGKRAMPAWGGVLKAEEIESLWAYVSTGGAGPR